MTCASMLEYYMPVNKHVVLIYRYVNLVKNEKTEYNICETKYRGVMFFKFCVLFVRDLFLHMQVCMSKYMKIEKKI